MVVSTTSIYLNGHVLCSFSLGPLSLKIKHAATAIGKLLRLTTCRRLNPNILTILNLISKKANTVRFLGWKGKGSHGGELGRAHSVVPQGMNDKHLNNTHTLQSFRAYIIMVSLMGMRLHSN